MEFDFVRLFFTDKGTTDPFQIIVETITPVSLTVFPVACSPSIDFKCFIYYTRPRFHWDFRHREFNMIKRLNSLMTIDSFSFKFIFIS